MELEENISPTSVLEVSNDTSNLQNQKDDIDVPPKSSEISNCDIFFLILSIVTHFTDFGVDINLVVQYYLNKKLQMFAWTITLILVPSFINTVVSLQMYRQDEKKSGQNNEVAKKKSIFKRIGKVISVAFIVIFQFTMAQRCIYSLTYALKSRNCKKKMIELDKENIL